MVHVLAAAHRVGEMDTPVVTVVDIGERGRDAAFGHHRMGLAEKRLADQSDFDSGGGSLDGGSQSGAARSHHQHIMSEGLKFRH